MALSTLHLCSGYGGFEIALKVAGIDSRTVCHVERDSYAAATLVARMEDQTLDQAPIWSEIETFDSRLWSGRVDLVTAGLPCQPFSVNGLQRGTEDERHLWPHAERIIRDLRPRFVVLENVPKVTNPSFRWLESVLHSLAQLGYDAEWDCFSASDLGAPHHRERFWLLAYSSGARLERHRTIGLLPEHEVVASRGDLSWPPRRRDPAWTSYVESGGPEPAIRRGSYGPAQELAQSLKAGGNGLVPVVAAAAILQLGFRAGIVDDLREGD